MYKILQFQWAFIFTCLIIYWCALFVLAKPQNQTSDVQESEEKVEINPILNENKTIDVKVQDWDDDWDHGHHDQHHNHHEHSGWDPSRGSGVWLHYHHILNRCVNYNGVPWNLQQAVHRCRGDHRAEKNFDCFVLCVFKEVGMISPVHINGNTYYVDNYRVFSNVVDQGFSEDRCTKSDTFTTLQSCKSLLHTGWYDSFGSSSPPHGLYPDLDNCGALHGVFKCGYLSFFKLHNCNYRREDQDWLLATQRNMTESETLEDNLSVELETPSS